MRFSEAVRLGAMLGPQGFGKVYEHSSATLCAGQAATRAVGVAHNKLFEVWPELLALYPCPVCKAVNHSLGSTIAVCLNDTHKWTREKIADWYERTFETPTPEKENEPARVLAHVT